MACGQHPKRIVSTAPSITELLYALGLGDRVVGVDRFSRYPARGAAEAEDRRLRESQSGDDRVAASGSGDHSDQSREARGAAGGRCG